MNGSEFGDRERRLGQVLEVVLREARLVDEDHRVRRRPVDEAHRHRAVRRMVDRALALDDDPVGAVLALLDEPLHGAIREVADDPIDGHAPALDHHPGLAGRDHGRRGAVASRGRDQFQGHGHLADRAVRPDGQDHALARADVAGRRRSPSGPAAAGSRSGACRPRRPPPRTPGRRRGTDAARSGCPGPRRSPRGSSSRHAAGRRPPVGAMPINSPFGRTAAAERLVERRDEGTS